MSKVSFANNKFSSSVSNVVSLPTVHPSQYVCVCDTFLNYKGLECVESFASNSFQLLFLTWCYHPSVTVCVVNSLSAFII